MTDPRDRGVISVPRTSIAASALIGSLRGELVGRTADGVYRVLRQRFDEAGLEMSPGELQRIAIDLSNRGDGGTTR